MMTRIKPNEKGIFVVPEGATELLIDEESVDLWKFEGSFAKVTSVTVKATKELSFKAECFKDWISLKSFIAEAPEAAIVNVGTTDLFYGCVNLKRAVLNCNLEVLGDGFFMECNALREVVLPKTIKRFSFYCFAGCTSLERLKLPDDFQCVTSTTALDSSNDELIIEFLGIEWTICQFLGFIDAHNKHTEPDYEFAGYDSYLHENVDDGLQRDYKTLGECIVQGFPEELAVVRGIDYVKAPEETSLF